MDKYLSVDKVKTTDDDKQIIEFVASKEIVDYSDDIVKLSGIDLSKIKKNKSLLFSHKQWDLPVGKIQKLWIDGNELKGKAQLASESEYPFAATVYKLIKGGYLNNMSISFIPDYEKIERKKLKNGKTVNIIHNSTLLEISICNIGCNPGTNIEAKTMRKSVDDAWDKGVLNGTELNLMTDALDEIEKTPAAKEEITEMDYELEIKNLKSEIEELKESNYIFKLFDDDPKEMMYDKILDELKDDNIYDKILKSIS